MAVQQIRRRQADPADLPAETSERQIAVPGDRREQDRGVELDGTDAQHRRKRSEPSGMKSRRIVTEATGGGRLRGAFPPRPEWWCARDASGMAAMPQEGASE